jgi:Family of unknown function (DUF6319)
MDTPDPLSEQDVAAARAELAEGRPFPVWFTAAAVGVPVGGSAKVVSVGEVAEGDYIEVRPTGSRDTVFCAPNELTRTRPPRRRAQQAKQAKSPQVEPRQTEPPSPEPARPRATPARREHPARSPQRPPQDVSAGHTDPAPPAAQERRSTRTRAGAVRPAEVTVTLSSTAEGEWTVEVTTGRKRTVRPTPVQSAEVAKAARSLPAAVAEAIESSLAAARQRQVERVERLRAELDAAQRALQDLSG